MRWVCTSLVYTVINSVPLYLSTKNYTLNSKNILSMASIKKVEYQNNVMMYVINILLLRYIVFIVSLQ